MTITEHERNLRALPCSVSGMKPVTLHHCHGGSMLLAGWPVGMGQRQNPWLQLPLHAEYHVGSRGIDSGTGVRTWEARYGDQLTHLRELDLALGYDRSIFSYAHDWENEHRGKGEPVRQGPEGHA